MSAALRLFALLLWTAAQDGAGLRVAANPIRKVVGLMQDMQKEIETEREKEKALFEKFMCICTEYPSELQETVDEESKEIAELSAKLEQEKAEKLKFENELKGHESDKAGAQKDLAQAAELREKEKAEFEANAASSKAAIGGLEKAIPELEGGRSLLQNDVPGIEAAVESTPVLTAWQKKQVTAFLSGGSTEGGSDEVLGILKQMLDDMKKNLKDAENAEKVAGDGYGQLKGAKDQEIEVASESIEAKGKRVGELAVSIAQNSDGIEDSNSVKADAAKMLHTLTTTCDAKKREWEERLKVRGDEITAIGEAINILNDDDALDIFKKAIPSALAQDGSKAGLLQTRHAGQDAAHRHAGQEAVRVQEAYRRVRESIDRAVQAERQRSARRAKYQLLVLASRAAQAPDLGNIEKIPTDMISNLEKQGQDDQKKKAFCTAEIQKAEQAEKAKQEGLDSVSAAMAEINDELSTFAEDCAAIEKEINEIDRSVAQATEQRKSEHAEYAETLQMTDVAVELVEKAKNRLNQFYNPSLYKEAPKAAAPSFFQRHSGRHAKRQPAMPTLPELPKYEKKNSGGVIAMLDKIVVELNQDKADAGYEEKTAQKEYVELMKESGDARSVSKKSLVEKQASKAELNTRLVEAKESSKALYTELTNAHKFTGEIHKTCDFLLGNFEAREEARKSEEESLESAKQVLHSLASP